MEGWIPLDGEGVEMKGSIFNLETKSLNYVNPDPTLAKCVKHGKDEE